MSWNLSFISEQEFTEHVRATIQKYGDKLESFDLRRFNRNISEFFSMYQIAMCRRTVKKVAGM